MSFAREKDGERRFKSDSTADADTGSIRGSGSRKKKRADTPEIGSALRTVYQRTVDESIPPEMLDLLGKLG